MLSLFYDYERDLKHAYNFGIQLQYADDWWNLLPALSLMLQIVMQDGAA